MEVAGGAAGAEELGAEAEGVPVRVPNGGGLGCFLAVSLPRRGTASNKDRKGNEGRCGRMEQGIRI